MTDETGPDETGPDETGPDETGPDETAGDGLSAVDSDPLGGLMEMAQNLTSQMEQAQEELGSARVVGTSGGGLVSVTLNGHLHLISVKIDPEAMDPEDPSLLEDLLSAAWQDAHDQVASLQAQASPMGALGGDFGGLGGGLGGLGGLLGGG